MGSKFFPFRVYPFSDGRQSKFKIVSFLSFFSFFFFVEIVSECSMISFAFVFKLVWPS